MIRTNQKSKRFFVCLRIAWPLREDDMHKVRSAFGELHAYEGMAPARATRANREAQAIVVH